LYARLYQEQFSANLDQPGGEAASLALGNGAAGSVLLDGASRLVAE
jgi:hypothetical protein